MDKRIRSARKGDCNREILPDYLKPANHHRKTRSRENKYAKFSREKKTALSPTIAACVRNIDAALNSIGMTMGLKRSAA